MNGCFEPCLFLALNFHNCEVCRSTFVRTEVKDFSVTDWYTYWYVENAVSAVSCSGNHLLGSVDCCKLMLIPFSALIGWPSSVSVSKYVRILMRHSFNSYSQCAVISAPEQKCP